MLKMKFSFFLLIVVAATCLVPAANAQTVLFAGAGSSAMFAGFGVAAYNPNAALAGQCPVGSKPAAVPPCSHWTSKGAAVINLVDSRNAGIKPETGNIWVVWDSAANTDVWLYVQVDSGVGDRCYFAQPPCNAVLAAS